MRAPGTNSFAALAAAIATAWHVWPAVKLRRAAVGGIVRGRCSRSAMRQKPIAVCSGTGVVIVVRLAPISEIMITSKQSGMAAWQIAPRLLELAGQRYRS
eukprot:scaffold186845_cov15-Tisochrysis_lutea.AAC.1